MLLCLYLDDDVEVKVEVKCRIQEARAPAACVYWERCLVTWTGPPSLSGQAYRGLEPLTRMQAASSSRLTHAFTQEIITLIKHHKITATLETNLDRSPVGTDWAALTDRWGPDGKDSSEFHGFAGFGRHDRAIKNFQFCFLIVFIFKTLLKES